MVSSTCNLATLPLASPRLALPLIMEDGRAIFRDDNITT